MADNVAFTPGTGATGAADDIGGIYYPRVKLGLGADGTANDAVAGAGAVGTGVQRVTLASDDPVVTRVGEVQASPTANTVLDRLKALLTGTVLASGEGHIGQVSGHSFNVTVTPTVTNGAYSAGDIVGALITVAAGRVANGKVTLQSVQIALKAAVTSTLTVVLLEADPSSTTKTDNAAYSLSASDAFKVNSVVTGFTLTDHGTPNTYSVHNLGRVITTDSSSQFYALIIDGTGFTLTSTSDLQIRFSGYQD